VALEVLLGRCQGEMRRKQEQPPHAGRLHWAVWLEQCAQSSYPAAVWMSLLV